jgi:hypothetical protein
VGEAVGREPYGLSIVRHGDTLGHVDGEEDIYDYESGDMVLDPKRARGRRAPPLSQLAAPTISPTAPPRA